jgi:hypothetical protein
MGILCGLLLLLTRSDEPWSRLSCCLGLQGQQLTERLECEVCQERAAGSIAGQAVLEATVSGRREDGTAHASCEARSPQCGTEDPEAACSRQAQNEGISPTPQQPRRRKLRILCLHGFRQNGSSFRGRTAALAKRISSLADLVFVDAPHPLPFFVKQPAAVSSPSNGRLDSSGDLHAHQDGAHSSAQGGDQHKSRLTERSEGESGCMPLAKAGSSQHPAGKLRRAWLLEPCQVEASQVALPSGLP